jgi:hypothetical protein
LPLIASLTEQLLLEQVSAEAAAKAKEERIESFRVSAVRRIKNKDLSAGWTAWHDRWLAKTYAMARLRECGNRLHTPGLALAFESWATWWADLKRTQLEEQAQLVSMKATLEEVIADRQALRNRVTELDGGVSEAVRLRAQAEAEAKEERIELMRKQAIKRVLNRDLASGWGAWLALWQAKSYALRRLHECGNRLKSPALADGFGYWHDVAAAEKQQKELLAMAQRAAGLDSERSLLRERLASITSEYEARLQRLEEQRVKDLERQMIALTGTAEEQLAMLEEKAREARLELMRRQVRALLTD